MWAIVPIKTFDMAKQRLANDLSASERKSLMLAMARDVLTALSSSTLLDQILIVSRAPEADALAQAFNTERFSETPSASLANALEQATHHLVNNFNAEGVFVVPADVPGVNAEELDSLISSHQTVTVLPDAKKVGTNGLICSPPLAIPYILMLVEPILHSDIHIFGLVSVVIIAKAAFNHTYLLSCLLYTSPSPRDS